MKIAAGITTWQDGDALANAVASVRQVVDHVLIADGLIDGIDAADLPWYSKTAELEQLGDVVTQGLWRSQSQQRDWTLQTARNLGCDWLLAIDADEELRNPEALRPWLEAWPYDAFPLPFYFTDQQEAQPCAFKLLNIRCWRRYVCQGSILENQAGETVQVMGQTTWRGAREAGLPYLVHRPELRPAARQAIRLSEHEVALEPYPPEVKAWLEPVHAPRLLNSDGLVRSLADAARSNLPVYYCPACGRRYAGPGGCQNQHPRTDLEPLEVAGASAV